MVAVPSLHPSPGFPGVPAIPAFSLSGCVSIVHFKLSAWPHLLSAVPLEHFASLVGHGAGFRSCCIVPRLCRTTCNNPLGDFHGCPDARRPVALLMSIPPCGPHRQNIACGTCISCAPAGLMPDYASTPFQGYGIINDSRTSITSCRSHACFPDTRGHLKAYLLGVPCCVAPCTFLSERPD